MCIYLTLYLEFACQGDHGDEDLAQALRELSEQGRHLPLVVFGVPPLLGLMCE